MIFRQLFDTTSSTYTYLLGDERSHEALIIDPVFEQHGRDVALVRELGLTVKVTIDTHCHADHVTGSWLLKEALGAEIALSVNVDATNVDRRLKHKDTIAFGSETLVALAT